MMPRRPPRILHVVQPIIGGVPAFVVRLAGHQTAKGWEVAVAHEARGSVWEALPRGVASVDWPARRSPGPTTVIETLRLRRIVERVQPDIVHLHSAKAGLAGRIAVRGRRATIFQPHGWSFLAVSGVVRRGAVWWERRSARWATALVCVSEAERVLGETTGIRGALRVIPNGTDTTHFRVPTVSERASARARLEIADDDRVAICVGRFSEAKGQDQLLMRWPDIAARFPRARLLLVGHGASHSPRATTAVNVIAVDNVEDIRPFLWAADAFVAPSRWEGASLAVLEAMACGLPGVMTDVAGAHEVVGAAGGRVVPLGDMPAFARELVAVMSDDQTRSELAYRAREYVAAAHDISQTLAALDGLYHELLDTGVA
jgi:glycosyltransferase involved in cell wall biosynthesis